VIIEVVGIVRSM